MRDILRWVLRWLSAVDATPKPGHVVISVTANGGCVLTVSAQGGCTLSITGAGT